MQKIPLASCASMPQSIMIGCRKRAAMNLFLYTIGYWIMKENAIIIIGRKVLGVALIALGVLGLVLPGLQGIAMIAAGILLVGNKKLIDKSKELWEWVKSLVRY